MIANNNPLVSVVIPTYKRSEKLARAIKSVLNQTYTKVEVLVVSDNEPYDNFTKEAAEVVNSFADKRVRLVTQERHINGAAARNAGIKASTGDYVAFLDDDDFWDREKLEIQVPVLSSLDSSWGGVSCLNKIFKGGKLSHLQQGYKSGYLYKNILLRRLEVSTDTVLLRREYLIETGMYDERLLRHQEVQMLSFFTKKYKIKLIDKYLCNVDIDDNQNRPSPQKLKEVKKAFLNAVSPITETMSFYYRYSIKLANYFELGGVYILNKEYVKGALTCLSIIFSPSAIKSAYLKISRRRKARHLPLNYQGVRIEQLLEQNDLL